MKQRLSSIRRQFPLLSVGLLACVAHRHAQGEAPCRYDATILPSVNCGFGPTYADPQSINVHGHVLGVLWSCGLSGETKTLLWTGGQSHTVIPKPPGMLGFAGMDLTDDGVIVGYGITANGGQRAFMYKSSKWTELPPIHPEGWSVAWSINAHHAVCGWRSVSSPFGGPHLKTAFIWREDTGFNDLGLIDGESTEATDLNDSGVATVDALVRSFLWDGTRTREILGPAGEWIYTRSIDNQGTVLGSLHVPIPDWPYEISHGYVWRNGQMDLPDSLAGDTGVNVVANAPGGVVIGHSYFIDSVNQQTIHRPCLWEDDGIAEINPLVAPGSGLTVVYSVDEMNSSSVIAGTGRATNSNLVALILIPRFRSPGDVNCDALVNVNDLLGVIASWGPCSACPADLNYDNFVNMADLLIVILYG